MTKHYTTLKIHDATIHHITFHHTKHTSHKNTSRNVTSQNYTSYHNNTTRYTRIHDRTLQHKNTTCHNDTSVKNTSHNTTSHKNTCLKNNHVWWKRAAKSAMQQHALPGPTTTQGHSWYSGMLRDHIISYPCSFARFFAWTHACKCKRRPASITSWIRATARKAC